MYFVALCYSTLERKSTASPSVIVIGAGFAGIAAARALHDAAFQVYTLDVYLLAWHAWVRILVLKQVNFAGCLVGIT